jgi:hypothetical protein
MLTLSNLKSDYPHISMPGQVHHPRKIGNSFAPEKKSMDRIFADSTIHELQGSAFLKIIRGEEEVSWEAIAL